VERNYSLLQLLIAKTFDDALKQPSVRKIQVGNFDFVFLSFKLNNCLLNCVSKTEIKIAVSWVVASCTLV
jgi:hypothetical protein